MAAEVGARTSMKFDQDNRPNVGNPPPVAPAPSAQPAEEEKKVPA